MGCAHPQEPTAAPRLTLNSLIPLLRAFLLALAQVAAQGSAYPATWTPSGPWRSHRTLPTTANRRYGHTKRGRTPQYYGSHQEGVWLRSDQGTIRCEVWVRTLSEINQALAVIEGELQRLDARRAELLEQVAGLKQERAAILEAQPAQGLITLPGAVTNRSSQGAKVAFFRGLFRGREDVYARRFESLKTGKKGYQPVCRNEWVSGVCEKPRTRCDDCRFREYVPVTDAVVRNHLLGLDPQDRHGRDFTMGVYPMLPDETCRFLAADFDKATWLEDARAFLETCKAYRAPASLERSRSGNGGHCWHRGA